MGACWLRKGGGRRAGGGTKPLGDRGRHPCFSNTVVTVGGGRELSGSEPCLYILELPVDIHSCRRRKGT